MLVFMRFLRIDWIVVLPRIKRFIKEYTILYSKINKIWRLIPMESSKVKRQRKRLSRRHKCKVEAVIDEATKRKVEDINDLIQVVVNSEDIDFGSSNEIKRILVKLKKLKKAEEELNNFERKQGGD